VHVARAEAAEDGEEVDFADVGQRKEEIKGEVAAAEVHKLDSLREDLLDDVETAVC
jgi:predicted small metal-binding protein